MSVLDHLRNKRIGIAGLGYIGKHLFNYLDSQAANYEFQVSVLTRADMGNIKGLEFDYFFNCAGNTGDFRQKIWETLNSNLSLTHHLLTNLVIREAYVALSSTRLYGFSTERDIVFEEQSTQTQLIDHLSIDFVYDGTKKLLESALWNFSKTTGFRIVICRLSNLYGGYTENDLNDSTFLKLMLRCKSQGQALHIKQNINSTKGYIFIGDAVKGLIHGAVYSPESDIYNICSGESYSILDWLEYLQLKYTTEESGNVATYSRNSIEKAGRGLHFRPEGFLRNMLWKEIYSYQ